jgi:CheY-like chemotaxis protein
MMLENFEQSWNLSFSNKKVEMDFKKECIKLHYMSSFVTLIGLMGVSLYLVFLRVLPIYFLIFFTAPLAKNLIIRALILEAGSLMFLTYNLSNGNIPELLGCFLPSFLLQFFVWKRYEIFFLLNSIKLAMVYEYSQAINGMIVVSSYSFLAFLIEKDFRNNWVSMKRHKESNHLYRELWMKIPYPVFIISQKSLIVVQNIISTKTFPGLQKIENIFTQENKKVVNSCIKKVFEGSEKEEIILKEKNSNWMIIFKSVEWKFERCVELSLIEILESNFSEKIFENYYTKQEICLNNLNEAILETFKEQSKVSANTLEIFYRFCINYWSYQIYLEQQTEYLASQDKKPIDFSIEIINTIEIFNIKPTEKKLDYKFTNDNAKVTVLANEKRLKLFLYVVIDFAKKFAENNSLVQFTLQSFDANQTICYTFTCSFTSHELDSELLLLIFKKKKKNIEEFESFLKKFDLCYGLFYSNLKALSIDIKQITYSKKIATVSFFIKFLIVNAPSTSALVQLCTNRIVNKSKILWHNQEGFFKSYNKKLVVQKQESISINKKTTPYQLNIIQTSSRDSQDSFVSNNSPQNFKLMPSPKSLQQIIQVSSISGIIIETIKLDKVRRSSTLTKCRKSKNNHFSSPSYSKTSKRPVKKFLYNECLRTLNYEVGVFKILIVDDFEENRKISQELLKKIMPVSCEFAKDGIGALEMYDNYTSQGYMYQIIFMDLIMPRLNGYQASLRIRQKEKENSYPRTFICAVSGNKDCSAKCIESEMDDIGK